MRIDKYLFSIPPYLITAWENVVALTHEDEDLIVLLVDGSRVRVPDLKAEDKNQIFSIFEDVLTQAEQDAREEAFLELPSTDKPSIDSPLGGLEQLAKLPGMDSPLRFAFGPGVGFQSAVQHDSSQMNAPDLPAELLEKVAGLAKVFGAEELEELPKAEPHCNCVHCQLMRTIAGEERQEESIEVPEEEVTDEDLRFRTWDIEQSDDKLFIVSNPLDHNERYTVYLGDEIGCTCGEKDCDHLRSVLLS